MTKVGISRTSTKDLPDSRSKLATQGEFSNPNCVEGQSGDGLNSNWLVFVDIRTSNHWWEAKVASRWPVSMNFDQWEPVSSCDYTPTQFLFTQIELKVSAQSVRFLKYSTIPEHFSTNER